MRQPAGERHKLSWRTDSFVLRRQQHRSWCTVAVCLYVESGEEVFLCPRDTARRSAFLTVQGRHQFQQHLQASDPVRDLVSEGQHDGTASMSGNQDGTQERARSRRNGAGLLGGDDRLPRGSGGGRSDRDRTFGSAVPGLRCTSVDRGPEQRVLFLKVRQFPGQGRRRYPAIYFGHQ